MKSRVHPTLTPIDGAPPRRRLRVRIAGKLHWIAIALWASAFLAALIPLLGL